MGRHAGRGADYGKLVPKLAAKRVEPRIAQSLSRQPGHPDRGDLLDTELRRGVAYGGKLDSGMSGSAPMSNLVSDAGRIPAWRFVLRLVWVVLQLMLVYLLGESGAQFFYQGF